MILMGSLSFYEMSLFSNVLEGINEKVVGLYNISTSFDLLVFVSGAWTSKGR